jgi:hypothetical protein
VFVIVQYCVPSLLSAGVAEMPVLATRLTERRDTPSAVLPTARTSAAVRSSQIVDRFRFTVH